MTTCIAAACREAGEPRVVLCSDTRLSQGEWGSRELTVKFDIVGRGWVVQWANRPDSARELIERIKESFRSAPPPKTVHSVLGAIREAINEFKRSPLCEPGCCEVILTGFVCGKPVIACVQGDDKGKLSVRGVDSFCAIGTGATIATVILNCRQYDDQEEIQNATYMVYEARRFSEKAEGVGPYTAMLIQAPGQEHSVDKAWVAFVSRDGIGMLETIFHSVGLMPKLTIEPFPAGFLISSTDLEATGLGPT
jgi:hypothetical protein